MLSRRITLAAVQVGTRRANVPLALVPRAIIAATLQQRAASTAQTQKGTIADEQALLAAQRLRRPVSPHLEVYAKDQTWFGASAWQRITGSIFSGGLYVFAAAYLVAPLTGWHLESASVAAAVATWPAALKGGLKFFLAWPFMFHFWNGIRHIILDSALVSGYSKHNIKNVAWGVWGASVVTALGLVAFI